MPMFVWYAIAGINAALALVLGYLMVADAIRTRRAQRAMSRASVRYLTTQRDVSAAEQRGRDVVDAWLAETPIWADLCAEQTPRVAATELSDRALAEFMEGKR